MKQWIKPEIKNLSLNETKTQCDCGATLYKTSKNEHYCHRDKVWHQNNCMSLQQGHIQSDKCPNDGNHEWAGEPHKSNCCCGSYDTIIETQS